MFATGTCPFRGNDRQSCRHADCERMTYYKTNFFCTDLRFAVIEPPNDIENFFFNGARMPQRG